MKNIKKKVGIITFHYAYNYGSKLQTYAMQTFLESQGYDARIINYIYDFDAYQYHLFHWKSYKERPKRLIRDLLTLPQKWMRKICYLKFDKNYLNLTQEIHDDKELETLNKDFDAYIAGSDQIWNPACTCAVVPAYFLEFAAKTNIFRMSYAPSIAHDEIESQYVDAFQKGLENFDVISVREETGRKLCQKLTNKKVTQISDPVILLSKEDYRKIEKPVKNIEQDEFIFVYTLEKNDKIDEYIQKLGMKHHLKIVYFSEFAKMKFGKNIYKYGPCQFLWLIRNARFVVTNSFHATAFSVIFQKQFLVFTTEKSGSRMCDFLKKFGLEDRIYTVKSEIETEIDKITLNKKLKEEQNRCRKFLNTTLENGIKISKS